MLKNKQKLILVGVLSMLSILMIVIGIYFEVGGREVSNSKVVEFLRENLQANELYLKVNEIDRFVEVQALEGDNYKIYFSSNIPDDSINSTLEEYGVFYEISDSIGVTKVNSYINYTFVVIILIVILFVVAFFGNKEIKRITKLKLFVNSLLVVTVENLLILGMVSLFGLLGLYRVNLWTVSIVEFFVLFTFLLKFIELSVIKNLELPKSKDNHEIFTQLTIFKLDKVLILFILFTIVLISLYIITAFPYLFGVVISIFSLIIIFLFETQIRELFWSSISDRVEKIKLFKTSKFWNS